MYRNSSPWEYAFLFARNHSYGASLKGNASRRVQYGLLSNSASCSKESTHTINTPKRSNEKEIHSQLSMLFLKSKYHRVSHSLKESIYSKTSR